MDAWIKNKDRLIEGILASTLRMLEAARAQDLESFEARALDRARLLAELTNADQILKNIPSALDSIWRDKLLLIQKMDEEIHSITQKSQRLALKDLSHFQNLKSELIEDNGIDPRGYRLEAKA